jgi:acetyl esterase/lipase
MKYWWFAVIVSMACGPVFAESARSPAASSEVALWPGVAPSAEQVPGDEVEEVKSDHLIAGKPWRALTNITKPSIEIFPPPGKSTGTAVVVIPGGGFEVLAMDLEGTETCDWVTSIGATCVVLKYRVPSSPYDWRTKSRPQNFTTPVLGLEDAQRAIRLVRAHAAQWHVNPARVGVLGYSAGGYLVAEISTRYKEDFHPPVDATDKISARPDFALAIYPGHIASDDNRLNPNIPVSAETPPTFLLQAEDDYSDGVNQALVYYSALVASKVPAEMHLYPTGGHAFGLRKTKDPITDWPALATVWLRSLGMLGE